MKSVCTGHYPQIVYRNGKRRLWNPVMKKPAVSLPEERVRLRFLEALMHESTIPPARISTEKGLEMIAGQAGRTDILCYGPSFKPYLLVECKREQVRLNDRAALQIGRYNEKINAPVLALTNGDTDLWFSRSDNGSMIRLELPPPAVFPGTIKRATHNITYWVERGFAGQALLDEDPELQIWVQGLLYDAFATNRLPVEPDTTIVGATSENTTPENTTPEDTTSVDAASENTASENASIEMNPEDPEEEGRVIQSGDRIKSERITYMHIPPSRHIRDLAHFYLVSSWPHEKLMIGVTSVSATDGSTHFVALAVRDDMPVAMLQVNPALMAGRSDVNAFFRAQDLDEGFDISKKAGWGLNSGKTEPPGNLSDLSEITRTLLKDYEV